jgi:xanthine dehydrogenase accessory factor
LPADRTIPVVIMTHRYRDDRLHLPLALARCDRYVGLLGPRKRTERLLAELAGEGFVFTEEMKSLFHAPVGLALGATTPAGVALAILAEIQACLAQGCATPLRDRPGPIHA